MTSASLSLGQHAPLPVARAVRTIRCPACDGGRLAPVAPLRLRVPGGILRTRVVACSDCTHHFLPTTPGEQNLIEDAAQSRHAHKFGGDPAYEAALRWTLECTLSRHVPPPARVLDVGCGNGAFLRAAGEAGHDAEGVDASEAAAAACRRQGLSVHAGDYLTMDLPGGYGMITLWDRIGRVREPSQLVARSRALMASDGALVLTTAAPGRAAFYPAAASSALAGPLLGTPDHVQFFNRRSLTALLEREGFTIAAWLSPPRYSPKAHATGLRSLAGRILADGIRRAAGNEALYVLARRT